jgi:gamma-glutamyltranspeptidase / glutathione hydrolase
VPTAHAVTVPGAVDAWCRLLADHGSKSLDELLRPAIHAARAGFPVAPRVAHDWRGLVGKLARDPVTAARFLPQGRAPLMGEHFVQPELARTLEEIAAKGRAGFYEGWVAEDLVARLKARGGLHELSDFAANVPTYVTPLAVGYRGFEVLELPPNGQGLIAQIMLNVLSGYEYGSSSYSEADRIHLLAEAAKAAYARRDALVGDPDHVDVPVERLLSAHEADRIRARIDLDRAAPVGAADRFVHADTTYLTVVDRDRTAVSFINSLFSGFGSGIMGERSGVMLQNRGSSFRLIEGHPNAIAPNKRPMHTIIPGMLAKAGRCVMPFGVMGGHFQPVGHTQLVTRMLDLGLDPQEALAHPRSFAFGGKLQLEPAVGAEVATDLQRRGHDVTWAETPLGGGQAIWIDGDRGVLVGGSETRKDGCALGY